jgi:protein-L-isoaspartate(D-aspartate) O-methyltransferase
VNPEKSAYERSRYDMVRVQLEGRGIRDARVLAVMGALPRELFVAEDDAACAYSDCPVGIGYGQTISQPYMTALMCQKLELRGHEIVLDVGTGSGYHAAVLASLARIVYSIEVIPELVDQARRNLDAAGLGGRVKLIRGDGSKGYAEAAPYDAISVAAAAPDVPPSLLEQLADPGRLVIPVGSREEQDLRVVRKCSGKIDWRVATMCRFVPLVGDEGWKN